MLIVLNIVFVKLLIDDDCVCVVLFFVFDYVNVVMGVMFDVNGGDFMF